MFWLLHTDFKSEYESGRRQDLRVADAMFARSNLLTSRFENTGCLLKFGKFGLLLIRGAFHMEKSTNSG